MRAQPMPSTMQPALTPAQAAKQLHMSVRELAALRRAGQGPECLVISPRTIRYLDGDLDDWRKRQSALRTAACATS